MDRRDFLKTLAAAGAIVSVKSSGMMDVMASTLPSGSPAAASDNADLAAIMNGEPAAMLEAAMKELGGMGRFIKKGDKIVIKPNIGWDRTPELAGNTNPDLIVAIIKMCQDAGAAEIKVFDHTCDNSIAASRLQSRRPAQPWFTPTSSHHMNALISPRVYHLRTHRFTRQSSSVTSGSTYRYSRTMAERS